MSAADTRRSDKYRRHRRHFKGPTPRKNRRTGKSSKRGVGNQLTKVWMDTEQYCRQNYRHIKGYKIDLNDLFDESSSGESTSEDLSSNYISEESNSEDSSSNSISEKSNSEESNSKCINDESSNEKLTNDSSFQPRNIPNIGTSMESCPVSVLRPDRLSVDRASGQSYTCLGIEVLNIDTLNLAQRYTEENKYDIIV